MNELALFAGAGGGILGGVLLGWHTVAGGALSPPWVEWLMGWPIGWTDLKPLETDKYHSWLRSLSALCSNALIFIHKHERHT